MKRLQRACLAMLLVVLMCLGPVLYRIYGLWPETSASAPLNHGGNALWLGHRWYDDAGRTPVLRKDIERLGSRISDFGIDYMFVHVGPADSRGCLPESNLARFRFLRAALPGVRWLAWVGAPNAAFEGMAPDTISLGDGKVHKTLVDSLDRLYSAGFAGVHYDFEPIANNDQDFLTLLLATKARYPDKLLSVAGPQLAPPGYFGDRFWSTDYYARVGRVADQVVLMGYDTMQPTENLYSRYLGYLVRELGPHIRCQFVVGLPTYDDNFPYHTRAESLAAGLRGAAAGGARHIALYAEWTTSDGEWQDLERLWGRAPAR